MKLESFWQSTAPAFSGAQKGDLPPTADVVVIGAGFTGISAALSLAQSGVKVVVLEAAGIMSQASARNGGHCNTGVSQNFSSLVSSLGIEQASRYYRAFADAVDYVEHLVSREQIDCDFMRCGKIKLASKPSHFAGLQATYQALHRHVDKDVTLLSASEVRNEVDSSAFHGGLLQHRSGQMHMGKFSIGLAEAAARSGAAIFEHTPVTGLQRLKGYQHRVSTAKGDIVADKVLMATGCSHVGPFAWFQRRIIPVGSFIVVTEPLPAAQITALMPGNRNCVTSMNIGNYFRTTVDNRLVFGGRARFAISNPTSDARSGKVLQSGMRKIFPVLSGVKIDYCWGGLVDMTADRLPHAGEQDGVFYSLGYSGHGTQMSVWMGQVMANLLAEKSRDNPWQRDGWPAVPGYFGKPWFLPVAGLYYKAKDWLS